MIWVVSALITLSVILKYIKRKSWEPIHMTQEWQKDNIYRMGKLK